MGKKLTGPGAIFRNRAHTVSRKKARTVFFFFNQNSFSRNSCRRLRIVYGVLGTHHETNRNTEENFHSQKHSGPRTIRPHEHGRHERELHQHRVESYIFLVVSGSNGDWLTGRLDRALNYPLKTPRGNLRKYEYTSSVPYVKWPMGCRSYLPNEGADGAIVGVVETMKLWACLHEKKQVRAIVTDNL